MVKILDPNQASLREALQQFVTFNLVELVKTYPSVAFHAASQRLVVGSFEGVAIIYDLKTATRLQLLEGHTKAISAVSFSNDGKLISTFSLQENNVMFWQPSVGFLSSLVGAFTEPAAGSAVVNVHMKCFRRFSVGPPMERDVSVPMLLQSVGFVWLAERTVQLKSVGGVELAFTKPTLDNETACRWLGGFANIVSQLKPSFSDLVKAVLEIDWASKDNKFFSIYRQFLENLVSAHATYIQPVVKVLIPHFLPGNSTDELDDMLSIFDRTHTILRNVLRLIPIGPLFLMDSLKENFPYKSEPIHVHVWYLKNILQVDEYAPVYRDNILALIIERMIQIDVEIQGELEELDEESIEEVQRLILDPTESRKETNTVIGELFEKDDIEVVDDVEMSDGYQSDGSSPISLAAVDVKAMIDKIDAMMQIVLAYLYTFGQRYRNNEEEKENIEEMFVKLLHIFEKAVLQTHKSRYTQFIWFYFCSFDSRFAEQFMGLLLSLLFDGQISQVIRESAAAYIASFTARGKYLAPLNVRNCLRLLNGWALCYLNENEDSLQRITTTDVRKYNVFYNVVQAMMYIFCFRWKELVMDEEEHNGSAGGMRFHYNRLPQEMHGFQRIITSRFAPLKVCARVIVSEFASLMHKLEIDYVYSLMENEQNVTITIPQSRNSRSTQISKSNYNLATALNSHNSESSMIEHLDTFFPFDPMTLSKRSSTMFIDAIYQNWEEEEEVEDVAGSFGMNFGDDSFSHKIGSLNSATLSTCSSTHRSISISAGTPGSGVGFLSASYCRTRYTGLTDDESDNEMRMMPFDFGKSPDFGRSPLDNMII
ncbi:hypothetical protein HK096_004675, partial [Nowakowskiella sp. JEL0078]